MEKLICEVLRFGETEYLPASEAGIAAEQHTVSGKGTAEEPYLVSLSVSNTSAAEWRGIIRLGCGCACDAEPYFLLPGFMVGTNRGDAPLNVNSKCARLRRGEVNFPASPWWQVRTDRLSHPAALVYSGGAVRGLSAKVRFSRSDKMQYAGFGCNIERGCVYYTLGWENAPWLFVDSHTFAAREITEEQCVTLAAGEVMTAEIYVFDYPAERILEINGAMRTVYNIFHEPPREGAEAHAAVEMLAEAIDQYAWIQEESAYSCFVFDYGKGYEYRLLPSISWTNGVSVAMPMLLAAHRLGREDMRSHALAFIQRVVDCSMNEASGLPWESYSGSEWSNHGWWFDMLPVPGHTGYIAGQTMYSILKAYEAEKRFAGVEHSDWLEFVQRVLSRLETTCNGSGEFPYVISEKTGAGLCYDSMSSAWCLAAAAYERLITGRRSGMEALLRSEKHYYDRYVSQMCCYGGPMDIDKQVDSEGVLAYLRAVRCLHRITGENYLIEHMRDALMFEFTFKFCYNSPVQTPPLNNGWCSCGGSITSVTNPHIHPMSSSVVDELIYCLDYTSDAHIRSRLADTVQWGLQTFNRFEGEYGFGLTGWMSERFCYSQGLLTERLPDGSPASTWFALMPWASCCIIEGLCGEFWDRKDIFCN